MIGPAGLGVFDPGLNQIRIQCLCLSQPEHNGSSTRQQALFDFASWKAKGRSAPSPYRRIHGRCPETSPPALWTNSIRPLPTRPSLSSAAPVSKSREMTGQWWTKRRRARSDGRGVGARILSHSVCESATPAFAQPELGSHMRHERSSSSTSGKVRIAWSLSCLFGLSHGRPLDICDRPGAASPPSVALLATALA